MIIGADPEVAVEIHNSMAGEQGVDIYTDGSGILGKVGAAAYCSETLGLRAEHVGPIDRFSV